MDTALYTGMGLCAFAGLRGAAAAARWLAERRKEQREFLASLQKFEEQLDQLQAHAPKSPEAWKGYRRFLVERVIEEAEDIRSIYLSPEDCRPLPPFLPGQFLALKIAVPGMTQPAVRCYSLSDRPRADYYRITVKAIRLDVELQRASGIVSGYLNRGLRPGDVVESQAPRGDFHLHDDPRPAVLIGAGIGITPLLSIASTLLQQSNDRQVILFYGVRNGRGHAFRDRLRELARTYERFSYLPCYSKPDDADTSPRDFVVRGRLDLELVRRTLLHADFPCYVCGPGAFMEAMVAGLQEWGVAEADLHFEAFGPWTVKRPAASVTATAAAVISRVKFQQSEVSADWHGGASLLELAESSGVSLPSGCRSGNCGMCAARVLAGSVAYSTPPTVAPDPGFCLTCVAQPSSPEVVLKA